MRRFLVVAAVLALPGASRADCGWVNGLTPTVVTPDKAPLVGGGGILVAQVPSLPTKLRAKQPAPPTWKLRDGALEDVAIAPGLTVRVPSGTTKNNEYELVDTSTKKHVVSVFTNQDLAAPVPVPNVDEVLSAYGTSYRMSGQVNFKAPGVPEGVAAIVLAGADGTPREFMLVKKGDVTANPIHGHCQQDPDGTLTTNAGDDVTLFFVDDHGRVGKPTKKLKVKPPR